MSIAELPSKIVESTSSLVAEKMKVCSELLKISYDKEVAVDEVFKKYTVIFNALNEFDTLNEITPQQKTAGFLRRHYTAIFLLVLFLVAFSASFLLIKNVK